MREVCANKAEIYVFIGNVRLGVLRLSARLQENAPVKYARKDSERERIAQNVSKAMAELFRISRKCHYRNEGKFVGETCRAN